MIARPRVAWWTLVAAACVGGMPACGDLLQPPEAVSDAAIPQSLHASEANASHDEFVAAHAHLFACDTDEDCTAVPRAGLCRNGVKEAVNRHHLDAYRKTFAHTRRGPCTFLLIRDRRIARCNKDTNRCMLVAPPDAPVLPTVFAPGDPE